MSCRSIFNNDSKVLYGGKTHCKKSQHSLLALKWQCARARVPAHQAKMQAHQDILNRGPLQDGLDGAKDLVLGNGHAVVHITEYSWGNVVTLVTCSLAFSSASYTQGRQELKLHG